MERRGHWGGLLADVCCAVGLPFWCSDQMGNKGAFITLKEDCKPVFTEFDAVVSCQEPTPPWMLPATERLLF